MNPLPMLAKPLPENFNPYTGTSSYRYTAEEKFDGHRLMVRVKEDRTIESWSRTGIDSSRKLVPELVVELSSLLPGVYDGELIATSAERSRSYSVSDLSNRNNLVFIVFDVLEARMLVEEKQIFRRAYLEGIFRNLDLKRVRLAISHPLHSREQLDDLARKVWRENGEGLIIKDTLAKYSPGKRTNAFMKVKQWNTAVLTIISFEQSLGEIVNRGPCAITCLADEEGNTCRVKTIDDETCKRISAEPGRFLGRKLRIDYTDRTPLGMYLNPHWDRFEEE